jgi:excisionase family DNA binding protein
VRYCNNRAIIFTKTLRIKPIAHCIYIAYHQSNTLLIRIQANNSQQGGLNMANDTMGLTLGEAANELRISQNTLTAWVKAGRVPYIRIGRKYLFSAEEIRRFLRGEYQPPAAPGGKSGDVA